MIDIKVSELDIQASIREALRRAVDNELRDRYGSAGILTREVQKALQASSADLHAAVRDAAIGALKSPEMQEQLKQAFTKKIASLFLGEYEGTLKAIARQAARDQKAGQVVEDIVKDVQIQWKNPA